MAKKYIDADRLSAEMEKRMHICDGVFERNSDTYYQGKAVAYQEILSFINSLQQEQPCEDLEEEIKRYGKEEMPVVLESDLNDIARHFYELGKQSKEFVSEDLEEEIHSFWNKCSEFQPPFCTLEVKENGFAVIARHFANWQKSQMLKDAVVGRVVGVYPLKRGTDIQYGVLYPKGVLPHKDGDKVKIVIVKED